MNDATRDPIGADARPATFDAWANEYCYGLFNDGDDGARVALLAARDAWDAAIASAAQPNNDWAQSAAELIAMRGYLADSADTPRVAHLLAQIVPATQRLPAPPSPRRTSLHEAACLAYGLLWHSDSDAQLVQRARMALLDELSRDDQSHGIRAAQAMGARVDVQALEAAMLRGVL